MDLHAIEKVIFWNGENDEFSKNVIFHDKQVLHQVENGLLAVGEHRFNFSLVLPEWTPSSVYVDMDDGNKMRVLVSVKVVVEREDSGKKG